MTDKVKWVNDTLMSICGWFELAKPKPTNKDICTQLGCHFEEVAELSSALPILGSRIAYENVRVSHLLKHASATYADKLFGKADEVAVVDALCDQIVTAVGVLHLMGVDVQGALAEVNRANWSKFEDGKPVFDENGKIKKGVNYSPPDLSDFMGNTNA